MFCDLKYDADTGLHKTFETRELLEYQNEGVYEVPAYYLSFGGEKLICINCNHVLKLKLYTRLCIQLMSLYNKLPTLRCIDTQKYVTHRKCYPTLTEPFI